MQPTVHVFIFCLRTPLLFLKTAIAAGMAAMLFVYVVNRNMN